MDTELLRQAAYEANMELNRQGLVRYTFGNASAIDRQNGIVAIKPSGVPYTELAPENMVLVDLDGRLIQKGLRPSSDTPTHLVLYRCLPAIGGVAHTHSTYATAWAQAVLSIPCLGTTHADHMPDEIPCTRALSEEQIKGAYEEETGLQIVKILADQSCPEICMALVAHHGPFTWGSSAAQAVYNSVILEELAQMAYVTRMLNAETPPLGKALVERHFYRKHGAGAYYGQETQDKK
jgi:L-ribulose-5-phosphate 4-epimerase